MARSPRTRSPLHRPLHRALLRCALVATGAIAASVATPACSSQTAEPTSSLSLSLSLPKFLDVDGSVKLYVYDQPAVPCAGAAIAVPPESQPRVFELALARCNGDTAWCGQGTLEKNPERVLTFYVEGRNLTSEGGFTGCTERAVDQDPLQLDLKAQPLVVGGKCGDLKVTFKETCDPGTGVVDEACDGATCQTKEVVLSNGKAVDQFHRGLPGRKKALSVRWADDGKFFAVWSDGATGASGGDGNPEITLRRTGPDLVTEPSPLPLTIEQRLPSVDSGATFGSGAGGRNRSGVHSDPSFVPIGGGQFLAVFVREGKVTGSVQLGNLNKAPAADFEIAPGGGTQGAAHAAASASGDVLVVYVEAGTVKSVLRKADGSLGSAQVVSSGGSVARPRVAWIGGDFVVVWSDGNDVKFRRLGNDGVPKAPEAVANQARTAGVQDQPDVAGFDTGEFVVVWRDAAGDEGADIRLQKFDKTGAPTGTEIAEVLNDVHKAGDQASPTATAGTGASGTRFYLVAWASPANGQIGARLVKADGTGFLQNFVNGLTTEFEAGVGSRPRSSPAVACSSAQNACAIAWSDDEAGDAAADDDRVRVRRFPLP